MMSRRARTTEEMVRLVPGTLREAAWRSACRAGGPALGRHCPPRSRGILTGALLAVARVAGETAPLLFTAFGNRFWNWEPRQPIASLPLQIFAYAIAPYEDWHRQAWAGALVLVAARPPGADLAARRQPAAKPEIMATVR